MPVKVTISGLDFSGEGTSFRPRFPDLVESTFNTQIAAAQGFQAACQGISLIGFEGIDYPALDTPRETDRPASPYAQRESKWLVTVADTVLEGKLYQFEIGGPDLTLVGSDGSTLDVSAGAGLAFKDSCEANLVGEQGDPVVFVKAVHVGRNN